MTTRVLFAAVLLSVMVGAQSPEKPPVLGEVDRLKLINAAQAVAIRALQVEQATSELEKARAEFGRLAGTLKIDGYDLKLETLEYVKKVDAKGGKQ